MKVVLMTALVPTLGHDALLDFANNFKHSEQGNAICIISERSFEPTTAHERMVALYNNIYSDNYDFIIHSDDNAPQNPKGENDKEFWDYWVKVVYDNIEINNRFRQKPLSQLEDNYLFTSEQYGERFAKELGFIHVPFDVDRIIFPIKGTEVRSNILENWEKILPIFSRKYKKIVTLFGAESCGKTTMAKYLAENLNGLYLPEYARGYLENFGAEVTPEKMDIIWNGQRALEETYFVEQTNKPFVFQDTDLLSTVGYYEIFSGKVVDLPKHYTKADLYILMSDQIPFEPDILRYGGNKRESNNEFWRNLLIKHGCNFVEMQTEDLFSQRSNAKIWCKNLFNTDEIRAIQNFKRE